LGKVLISTTLALALSVAFVPISNVQAAEKGWEKTVTLPSGEVILDMSGDWDMLFEYRGMYSWLGSYRNIVLITQEGNTFTAVRKHDQDAMHPKGQELIKGELDKDGFKTVHYNRGDVGWVPCKWEISENGNKIVVDDDRVVKATLTRK
jgi:hypothetical protein